MTLFSEISESLEKKLKRLGFDQRIEVKFSDFTKEYDVQINNLVSARKLDNYDLIKAEVTQGLESNNCIEKYERCPGEATTTKCQKIAFIKEWKRG